MTWLGALNFIVLQVVRRASCAHPVRYLSAARTVGQEPAPVRWSSSMDLAALGLAAHRLVVRVPLDREALMTLLYIAPAYRQRPLVAVAAFMCRRAG